MKKPKSLTFRTAIEAMQRGASLVLMHDNTVPGGKSWCRALTSHQISDRVCAMHLAEFLELQKMSDAAFAARIGVTRQAVHRYRHGRIPNPKTMGKIAKATKEAVTPNDFYGRRASA